VAVVVVLRRKLDPTEDCRFLAARRLREHGLVRIAPQVFAGASAPCEDSAQLRSARGREFLRISASLPRASEVWLLFLGYPLFKALIFAGMAILLVQVTIGSGQMQPFPPGASLIVPFVCAPWVLGYIRWFRARRRARAALADLLCPDCGFPLDGIPSSPSHVQLGVDLGPARCPECGSPWPLIPPAILKPQEITALHQSP
jgi:hypothetical protein